jgi:predicted DNA-binding protein YlxM (UPF0122 family)
MYSDEIKISKKAYQNWEESKFESPVEYIERKREIDTAALLEDVLKNELTQIELQIVTLYYFKSFSLSQIASETGVHRSTVLRRLETVNHKIYSNLKYVIKYQNNTYSSSVIPIAIRNAMALNAAKASMPSSVGGRITRLMHIFKIDEDTLCACLKIEPKRLYRIINGHIEPCVSEVVKISAFFDVSTDYLLIGKV